MKRRELDILFDRLRSLERGSEPSQSEKIQDLIFDKLRSLEQRADKLERLVYMGLGGLAALQFVLEKVLK